MERAIQIYAIVNFTIIGLSHVLRPRAWVDFIIQLRERGEPGVFAIAILALPFGMSLTAAEQAIERLGKPGFYRLVHTQRVIWAERAGDKLRLRKSHAGSPHGLEQMREMFDRTGGRYPVEEVQSARQQAKKKQAGKPG